MPTQSCPYLLDSSRKSLDAFSISEIENAIGRVLQTQLTIEFNESNGTYAIDATAWGGFAPVSPPGTVRVLGADLSVGICFRPVAAGSGTGSAGVFGLPAAEAAAVIGVVLAAGLGLFVLGVLFGRRSRRGGPTRARGRTVGSPPTVPPGR